jgi:hypothetical protein
MSTEASGPNDRLRDDSEVVGAVDGDGTDQEYVIADISEDEAWLSMEVDDAPALPAWR